MIKFFKGFSIFILIIFLFLLILIALIMPEQLDKHLSQVIAFIAVLTGLVSVIWTQYNKKIEEDNKRIQAKEDKKHQISKEKYQQLFEQKIDLYNNLYSLSLKYKQDLQDIGREDYEFDANGSEAYFQITEEDICFNTFKEIKTLIEKNIFVTSEELEVLFVGALLDYEKNKSSFRHIRDTGSYGDNNDLKDISEKMNQEFCNKHKITIDKLFYQVKSEISTLRSKI